MINSEYGFSLKSIGGSIVDYSKYDVRVYDCITFRANYSKFSVMEQEVWGDNSDPDFMDIPLWRAYTIENNIFTLGYVLLSTRYFKNGELNNEIKIDPTIDYSGENIKLAIDIEDFVIFNTRRAVPYIKKAMNMMLLAISELNPDFIVINPNNYSKPFVKRLEILGYDIKYYNYPKYRPEGYDDMKDKVCYIPKEDLYIIKTELYIIHEHYKRELGDASRMVNMELNLNQHTARGYRGNSVDIMYKLRNKVDAISNALSLLDSESLTKIIEFLLEDGIVFSEKFKDIKFVQRVMLNHSL